MVVNGGGSRPARIVLPSEAILPRVTGRILEDDMPVIQDRFERIVLRRMVDDIKAAGHTDKRASEAVIDCCWIVVGQNTPAATSLAAWEEDKLKNLTEYTGQEMWEALVQRHFSPEYKAHWRSKLVLRAKYDSSQELLSEFMHACIRIGKRAGILDDEIFTEIRVKLSPTLADKLDNAYERAQKSLAGCLEKLIANDSGTAARVAEHERGRKRQHDHDLLIHHIAQSARETGKPLKQPRVEPEDSAPCAMHNLSPSHPNFHVHADCDVTRRARGLEPLPRGQRSGGKAKKWEKKSSSGEAVGGKSTTPRVTFSGSCYECDQPGHIKRNCPKLRKKDDSATDAAKNKLCAVCDQSGHHASRCPSKRPSNYDAKSLSLINAGTDTGDLRVTKIAATPSPTLDAADIEMPDVMTLGLSNPSPDVDSNHDMSTAELDAAIQQIESQLAAKGISSD